MLFKRKAYPSDLTDHEWEILQPLLPPPKTRGRKRQVDVREIVNAIFYVEHTGCQWEYLPHDFPTTETVYGYFRQWKQDSTWPRLNGTLREKVRQAAGKDATPSAAILDSQSVKTTEEAAADTRGYDGGKQVKGRKRHLLVDTLGWVMLVYVSAASVAERAGAKTVFEKIRGCFPRLCLIWADGGYAGVDFVGWVKQCFHWTLEIVKRSDVLKGFVVLPHRWIVERTFGWLNRSRRLSKDYERLPETSEAWVYAAMTRLMVRRLARAQAAT